MILSMNKEDLAIYVSKQLYSFFPDKKVESAEISSAIFDALEKAEHCFSKINNKYFNKDNKVLFNHLNTDQYAMFLYVLSNIAWKKFQDVEIANKVYFLNKSLNGIDVFYEVNLPDIFMFVHPVGTVLGKAKYSDYFVCYQRCTVGGNLDLKYPKIGEGVAMFAGSSLIGDCTVEKSSLISAGTLVIDTNIPSNTIACGSYPDLLFKKAKRNVMGRFFING